MLATTCQEIADTRACFIFENTVKIWVCKSHIKKASVILFRLLLERMYPKGIGWEVNFPEVWGRRWGPGRVKPRRELALAALKPIFWLFFAVREAQEGLNVLDGRPL